MAKTAYGRSKVNKKKKGGGGPDVNWEEIAKSAALAGAGGVTALLAKHFAGKRGKGEKGEKEAPAALKNGKRIDLSGDPKLTMPGFTPLGGGFDLGSQKGGFRSGESGKSPEQDGIDRNQGVVEEEGDGEENGAITPEERIETIIDKTLVPDKFFTPGEDIAAGILEADDWDKKNVKEIEDELEEAAPRGFDFEGFKSDVINDFLDPANPAYWVMPLGKVLQTIGKLYKGKGLSTIFSPIFGKSAPKALTKGTGQKLLGTGQKAIGKGTGQRALPQDVPKWFAVD